MVLLLHAGFDAGDEGRVEVRLLDESFEGVVFVVLGDGLLIAGSVLEEEGVADDFLVVLADAGDTVVSDFCECADEAVAGRHPRDLRAVFLGRQRHEVNHHPILFELVLVCLAQLLEDLLQPSVYQLLL